MKRILLKTEKEGYGYLDEGDILLSCDEDNEMEYVIKEGKTYNYYNHKNGTREKLNQFIIYHVYNETPLYVLSPDENLKEGINKIHMMENLCK